VAIRSQIEGANVDRIIPNIKSFVPNLYILYGPALSANLPACRSNAAPTTLEILSTHDAVAASPPAKLSRISGKIKKDADASHPPINPARRAAR
jgi:hypothetical protein